MGLEFDRWLARAQKPLLDMLTAQFNAERESSDNTSFYVYEQNGRDKARERREKSDRELTIRIASLRDKRENLDRAQKALENAIKAKPIALKLYESAVIDLAEDDEDDFDTAKKKAETFAQIEADYIGADQVIIAAQKIFDSAMQSVRWELREATRLGYIRDGDAGKS